MVNNNTNHTEHTKYGFSLLEALIVMTMVSIFVAIMANVVPHKVKPKISAEAHGGFECYYDSNGNLKSRTITGGAENTEKAENGNDSSGDYCVFKPNQYVQYLLFNVVGGGSMGGTDNGGGAGQFTSAFFPTPKSSYRLYPGKGGTIAHSDGYPSFVKDAGSSNNLIYVSGGNEAATAKFTKISDIKDVYIGGAMPSTVTHYGCSYMPRAWIENQKIHVQYCPYNGAEIQEREFFYTNESLTPPSGLQAYDYILQTPSDFSRLVSGKIDEWEYYEVDVYVKSLKKDPQNNTDCSPAQFRTMSSANCPSRYQIKIKLDIPDNGESGAMSSLTKYATLMQYTNLENIAPGNGGAKSRQPGKAGGILVLW